MGASPGALESGGISRWLWRVRASTGGIGECGHLQGLWRVWASPGALESGGIYRWFWRVGPSTGQVAPESGGISRGSREYGHLQVALESGGIPGGFGEWGHLQVAL